MFLGYAFYTSQLMWSIVVIANSHLIISYPSSFPPFVGVRARRRGRENVRSVDG